jgi:AraC-like DNA-binding protein
VIYFQQTLISAEEKIVKLSELQALMHTWPRTADTLTQAQGREYMKNLGLEPGQLYQELEMESRFVDTHRDTSFANTSVALHSHSFYELLCCANTCGAEYLVGSERYRLRKGDIVVIAPGISHRPLLPEDMTDAYRRDVLWISADFAQQLGTFFTAQPLQTSGLLRTAGTKWEFLAELFHNGIRESEQAKPGWELAVIGNTITLLTQLNRAYQDTASYPLHAEKPALLDRAMAYIEENLSGKITLEEAARRLYVSQSTITQTFRKKMGVSFYRCVTQRRLIAAKTLIGEGVQLESVGQQVGFSDYSTFYRAFKQEFGISPRQYRKLQETIEPEHLAQRVRTDPGALSN